MDTALKRIAKLEAENAALRAKVEQSLGRVGKVETWLAHQGQPQQQHFTIK